MALMAILFGLLCGVAAPPYTGSVDAPAVCTLKARKSHGHISMNFRNTLVD